MSTLASFRAQAASRPAAIERATQDKARLRHQEASPAWTVFAEGVQRRAALRIRLGAARALAEPSENPDRGQATVSPRSASK